MSDLPPSRRFGAPDVGAPKTPAMYIMYVMYDVKQVDPSEWSSPSFAPALVDKPDLGRVLAGPGAINSKGPKRISRCRPCDPRRGSEAAGEEVKMTGGYDPTSTSPASLPVREETAIHKRNGIDPIVWPRTVGSLRGYMFTGLPLQLPAIQFGLGHRNGAQSPYECYLFESQNPKINATMPGHVEFLYEPAAAG
jgi:hypothetical protein